MPAQINGRTVGGMRVGRPDGTLATIGEARVWDGQWRTVYTSIDTVVITDDGSAYRAQDQFRAALTDYGLSYSTVTELPFRLDTSQVTDMRSMFSYCSALTSVPDLDTSQVTDMRDMFRNCSALTDGNVRLIGKHPDVNTASMLTGSGLTREPFYDTAGNPI